MPPQTPRKKSQFKQGKLCIRHDSISRLRTWLIHKIIKNSPKIEICEFRKKQILWWNLSEVYFTKEVNQSLAKPSLKFSGGLTHCGLVTQHGVMDLGQHWLRYWLVAWWHQAITWTNVDLSSVAFIWGQFHKRYLSHQLLELAWLSKIKFKSPKGQWVN